MFTLFWIIIYIAVYFGSGALASFIYTVRTLRKYPKQTSLDKTDRDGLIPVFIFSPVVMLYYLMLAVFMPYRWIIRAAEWYEVNTRDKRIQREKIRAENKRLADMTPEARAKELTDMLEELNSAFSQTDNATLAWANAEFEKAMGRKPDEAEIKENVKLLSGAETYSDATATLRDLWAKKRQREKVKVRA